jgi:hypothetical protein
MSLLYALAGSFDGAGGDLRYLMVPSGAACRGTVLSGDAQH